MRFFAFLLIVITGCSPDKDNSRPKGHFGGLFSTDLIHLDSLNFDSLELRQIVLENETMIGLPKRYRGNKEIEQLRTTIYETSSWNVVSDQFCGTSRHLFIVTTRNQSWDIEPYFALYLLVLDSTRQLSSARLIAEKEHAFRNETSFKQKLVGTLTADSVLTTFSESFYCSDFQVGPKLDCWRDKILKSYKLRCDGLHLIKSDSVKSHETAHNIVHMPLPAES